MAEVVRESRERVEGLCLQYLAENLACLRAQLVVAGNGEYLKGQSASELATLHGVIADKAFKISRSFRTRRRRGLSGGFGGSAADPVAYAEEVLKVEWWEKQVEIAQALLEHKRVFVKASHSVGKSFLAGGLVNWFFDCFDPGICITTAPNAPQVRDILWKEVRVQRPADLRGALQPKAPRMESSPGPFRGGLYGAGWERVSGPA